MSEPRGYICPSGLKNGCDLVGGPDDGPCKFCGTPLVPFWTAHPPERPSREALMALLRDVSMVLPSHENGCYLSSGCGTEREECYESKLRKRVTEALARCSSEAGERGGEGG